tara:strand:+ start:4872 stop:5396 length:525 start_codon:yes stop_codon:yes gene_type:complete
MATHFEYSPKLQGTLYTDSTEDIPANMLTYSCTCPRSTGKYNSKTRLIQHIKRDGHKSWLLSLNSADSCIPVEKKEEIIEKEEPPQEERASYIMPDAVAEEENVISDRYASSESFYLEENIMDYDRIINIELELKELKAKMRLFDRELSHQKNILRAIVLGAVSIAFLKIFWRN